MHNLVCWFLLFLSPIAMQQDCKIMYTIEMVNGQNVTKLCSEKLYVHHNSCNQKNYQFFLKVLLNCARDLLGLRWLCITLGCNAKFERPLLSKEIEGRKRQ